MLSKWILLVSQTMALFSPTGWASIKTFYRWRCKCKRRADVQLNGKERGNRGVSQDSIQNNNAHSSEFTFSSTTTSSFNSLYHLFFFIALCILPQKRKLPLVFYFVWFVRFLDWISNFSWFWLLFNATKDWNIFHLAQPVNNSGINKNRSTFPSLYFCLYWMY